MTGPSDKAVEAARAAGPRADLPFYEQILKAAHDPALGLERSVCLRDVVEFLRGPGDPHGGPAESTAADFIEREFGGGSSA